MTAHTVSERVVTLLFRGRAPDAGAIIEAVREVLSRAGLKPWREIEAEEFTYAGGSLIIARPHAPLCARGNSARTRLCRRR